jgi:hypothetical protein
MGSIYAGAYTYSDVLEDTDTEEMCFTGICPEESSEDRDLQLFFLNDTISGTCFTGLFFRSGLC